MSKKKNVIRSISVILVIIVILSVFGIFTVFASPPSVLSVSVSNKNPAIGTNVTFTVTTEKTASNVKILTKDNKVWALVDMNLGYSDFEDTDTTRIWNIHKNVQGKFDSGMNVIAGGFLADGKPLTINPQDPQENQSAESETNVSRGADGTFLQSWLCRDWTDSQWASEMEIMKEAKIKYLILQSTVDLVYHDRPQDSSSENYNIVTKDYFTSMYPSNQPELTGVNNNNDAIERCLRSAKKAGIKVYIGLVYDTRWWFFGWSNTPQLPNGKTDTVNDSYFAQWVVENAELNDRIATEVWDRYGETYGDTIEGWYYNNEVFNMYPAYAKLDGGATAKIVANSLSLYGETFSRLTPGKPMIMSPFFNRTLYDATAQNHGEMWEEIFSYADLREGDIFAPQDCIGGHPYELNNILDWLIPLKQAVETKDGLRFWVNNECFTPDSGAAPLSQVLTQINTTAPFCERNIIFSYNHYYSPNSSTGASGNYHNEYKTYVNTPKTDTTTPSKPYIYSQSSPDGIKLRIRKPIDDMAVVKYEIFYGSTDNKIYTLTCDKDAYVTSLPVVVAGRYFVTAVDNAGNRSETAEIEIA